MHYMGKYVLLLNWTDQGIKNVKDTIKRAESFKLYLEKRGGKLTEILYTFGQYDLIVTAELPSDETAMSVSLGPARWAMCGLQLLKHLVWMKREE